MNSDFDDTTGSQKRSPLGYQKKTLQQNSFRYSDGFSGNRPGIHCGASVAGKAILRK
jgi:hypothetical protein